MHKDYTVIEFIVDNMEIFFLFIILVLVFILSFFTVYYINSTKAKKKLWNATIKMQQALLEAEQADQAKSEFLRRMSHDIRTPINGVMGMTEIALHNLDSKERVAECLEKIKGTSSHLLSLINDVLDMSKLEYGKVELNSEPFHLIQMLGDCNAMMRSQMESMNVILKSEEVYVLHPNLIGSPLHVRQIFVNILGNAIKYNRFGGQISTKISEIGYENHCATMEIEIADTGIGISKEFQKHIFEPFSQEHNEGRSSYKGSGLGMSIAKSLTEQMGGTIRVESKLNVGTRVMVTIPFPVNEHIQQNKTSSRNDFVKKSIQVLLVEDNDLNQEITQFMLEELGATVIIAEDGKIALDYFEKTKPGDIDLILMDVMMPVMNGIEATTAIRGLERSDAKTIPIIALTANAFAEDVRQVKEAGMNAHLSKPLEQEKLMTVLEKFCCGDCL